MDLLIISIGLFSLILVANVLVVRQKRQEQTIFSILLFLVQTPLLVVGLITLFAPEDLLASVFEQTNLGLVNIQSFGLALILMAIWGMLVALRPVRTVLCRVMPLDPDSAVHILALIFSGYLAGQTALTLGQGGLSALAESAAPASIGLVVMAELLFAVAAVLGVGIWIRRDGRQVSQRLGLSRPKPIHWLAGIAIIFFLVILQSLFGALLLALNNDQAELLNEVNTALLGDFDTVWEWLLLAIAAGVGEELLFRGALQPVLGLGFTAVLFSIVHVQYGFTPVLIFVFFLGLLLGLVRRYYSCTISIFIHVGYNFTLGLIALLAPYLESLVN